MAWLIHVSFTSGLWFHELAHAAAQLLGGGMPRIVMCTGGGFAQAGPWPLGGVGKSDAADGVSPDAH